MSAHTPPRTLSFTALIALSLVVSGGFYGCTADTSAPSDNVDAGGTEEGGRDDSTNLGKSVHIESAP